MKRSKDVKPEPENDDDPNRPCSLLLLFRISTGEDTLYFLRQSKIFTVHSHLIKHNLTTAHPFS
jgi:hypothetical protein